MKARQLFTVHKSKKDLAPSVVKIIKSCPHISREDIEISLLNWVYKRY